MFETIALGAGIAITTAIFSKLFKNMAIKREKKSGIISSNKDELTTMMEEEKQNSTNSKTR